MRHVGEDADPRRADRVAQRNARTVDVDQLAAAVVLCEAPALEHGERLRGEGLVEFDQPDIVPAHIGLGEQPFDRGNGADPHPAGIAAGRAP